MLSITEFINENLFSEANYLKQFNQLKTEFSEYYLEFIQLCKVDNRFSTFEQSILENKLVLFKKLKTFFEDFLFENDKINSKWFYSKFFNWLKEFTRDLNENAYIKSTLIKMIGQIDIGDIFINTRHIDFMYDI